MVPVAVAASNQKPDSDREGGRRDVRRTCRREARIKLRKKIDSYEASPMKKAE